MWLYNISSGSFLAMNNQQGISNRTLAVLIQSTGADCFYSVSYILSYLVSVTPGKGYHHHVVPLARISLTLSRHFFLSFIASGRSPGRHPVSSHTCCMYVRAGRPAFARLYAGFHMSVSLMSTSLLFQLCPACLVRLTWIVFVMGGSWKR